MKVVITGALGHIGSYLIRNLPKNIQNTEIVMIDNLSTQRYTSLFNLEYSANYRFIEGNVLDKDIRSLVNNATVIHLAAATDAASSFDNKNIVEKNLTLTKKVAEACCETGSNLIFPSTTSVYGTQKNRVDEGCSIDDLQPQSPYAETKLREEKLLQEFGQSHNLNYIIFRFGTIFGVSPGMRFHTAVNKFCWQAAMNQPITVWSTAYNQRRPYLDLADACRAIEFIIDKGLYDKKIYNILTTNSTVSEIVDIIRELIPDLKVNLTESKIMNQLSYEVDNKRFRNLNFEFKGQLHRGINDVITLLKLPRSHASNT